MLEGKRIGVFSEVGHPESGHQHFSGVSNFLSYNVRFCKQHGVALDLHSYSARDRIDVDGVVQFFGWRPRMPVRVDPTIPQDLRHLAPDRRVLRVAAARRYDVINVVTPGTMGLQGVRVARRMGVPALAMYTTNFAEYGSKRALGILGQRSFLKRPAVAATEAVGWSLMRSFYSRRNGIRLVLAPTRRTMEMIGKRLDAPLAILGRGVDTDLFQPPPEEVLDSRAGRRPLMLYSGRIHRGDKNLDLFVEILDAIPDVRLLVVGDGPDREGLEAELGDRAEFTGRLTGRALGAAYRRCDFFVFPSKYDTFGQVVTEAMATGLPVVVSDQGGPQELVDDGVTGFVADEHSFVGRVRQLARSAELRRRMGRRARTAAEARSWTRIFEELMDHYRLAAASVKTT